jgi:hypothetical protein
MTHNSISRKNTPKSIFGTAQSLSHDSAGFSQLPLFLSTDEASFYIYNTSEEIDRFAGSFEGDRASLMGTVEDYVARIDETCGEEKGVIVIFKYDKKDEAIARILKKAKLKNSFSGMIFELAFRNISFRVFSSGKAIFRGISKEALHDILAELLL